MSLFGDRKTLHFIRRYVLMIFYKTAAYIQYQNGNTLLDLQTLKMFLYLVFVRRLLDLERVQFNLTLPAVKCAWRVLV